jgi:hypothetical protein
MHTNIWKSKVILTGGSLTKSRCLMVQINEGAIAETTYLSISGIIQDNLKINSIQYHARNVIA